MPDSQIVQLAKSVLESSTKIETYLQENDLPPLSFELNGTGRFGTIPVPADIEATRYKALEAGTELVELLRGPSGFFNLAMAVSAFVVFYRPWPTLPNSRGRLTPFFLSTMEPVYRLSHGGISQARYQSMEISRTPA